MTDSVMTIEEIDSLEKFEAYLSTRSMDEARIIAFRIAFRIYILSMPDIQAASLSPRQIKHRYISLFQVFLLCFFNFQYPDVISQETYSRLAQRLKNMDGLSPQAAIRAASRLIDALKNDENPAFFTGRLLNIFLDYKYSQNIDHWDVVRTDIRRVQTRTVPSMLSVPLWSAIDHDLYRPRLDSSEVIFRDFGGRWIFILQWCLVLQTRWANQFANDLLENEQLAHDIALLGISGVADDPDKVMTSIADILERSFDVGGLAEPDVASMSSVDVDFFISYSTRNEAEAREINRYLEDAGYSTIVQFKDFPVGSNFVIEMQDGLERGARAIALLSPDYVASDHCRAEWAAVYNMDPLGKGRKLVPLLLKPANLNTLARQIVYKSLVGLTAEERRAAVLEAIGPGPTALPPDLLKRRLAETASPDVAPTPDGKLDAVPNAVYDQPVFDADLPDLPEMLRTLCTVIQASLPENSPKTIAPSLFAYGNHLTERGVRPILGLLCILADALNRDVRSVEFHVWGDGLADLFGNFFSCHSKYVTHFPKLQEREEALATNEIDEDRASGKDFVEPVKKVAEALADLHEIGGTTPAFERVVQDSVQRARDIDSLPSPSDAGQGGDITPKRRFVFSQIGFWERILSALGSMTTLATTEQGRAAIATLREAIAKFLSFLSSN
jgi:hypothetical protein